MKLRVNARFGLVGIIFILGVIFLAKGSYMQAKAYFAQYLIHQAWQQTLLDNQPHKPWSWADTYPVAKLTLMKKGQYKQKDGRSLYVLSGTSGRNLAFGPTRVKGGGLDFPQGNRVIAGHNDTHFSVLNGIESGRIIKFEDANNRVRFYQVSSTHIVHETDTYVLESNLTDQLTLITCYPFNSLTPRSEFRLVVSALPLSV
nr:MULTISPECIES: class GN sortase [Shewanella]